MGSSAEYHRAYYLAHSTRPRRVAGDSHQEKVCAGCKVLKPRAEFTVRRSGAIGHLTSKCKACNADVFRAKRKAQIQIDPLKRHRMEKNQKLKAAYGISLADYEAMLVAQNGRCAICATDDPVAGGRRFYKRIDCPAFDVDHNHATGEVRGLLCSRCNRLVGLAGDDAARARQLAAYLEK